MGYPVYTIMIPTTVQRIRTIDSHTAGEPTRVIISGFPDPIGETMMEKRVSFSRDSDWLRTATVCEPRGHDAMVGALLCEPVSPDCVTGVIFFNNVACLNGCLHGTMGVAVTLLHLGRIGPGNHHIDTPTGVVTITVDESGKVTVRNVRSYRFRKAVEVEVPGYGITHGDVAWGGNWFFLTKPPVDLAITPENIETLTHYSWTLRRVLAKAGITGENEEEIDHIELIGPPSHPSHAESRNFVLCPCKAYDRSPCGTGTSAKLACLYDDGLLLPGQVWRQAGILDSVFDGSIEAAPEGGVFPSVSGIAAITAESEMIINPAQPFAFGIPSFVA